MDSSPRKLGAYSSLWDLDRHSPTHLDKWLERLQAIWHPHRKHLGVALSISVAAQRRIVVAVGEVRESILLAQLRTLLLTSLRREEPEALQESDAAQLILDEYTRLDAVQQEKVAQNLVLLWDNFEEIFGGLSGFLAAPSTEQDAFMEKFEAAARRMEPAKGTQAAFHYVTVELTRQYISFFLIGRSDRQAVALATCVATLIDSGRRIMAKPITSPPRSPARFAVRCA